MSEFSHLKNKLLAEQVEDEIYHYILDTPLEPGTKLPNEFELGEKFGVGRSTVREAVKLLSSKGIVEVRRGSGTYVVTTAKGLSACATVWRTRSTAVICTLRTTSHSMPASQRAARTWWWNS